MTQTTFGTRSLRAVTLAATVVLPLFALPGAASASGIPVFDGSNIAQTVAQLRQQIKDYEEQVKQLATMKEQLDNLKGQLGAITGPKGISTILNSAADRLAREDAPDLMSLVDAGVTGVGVASSTTPIGSTINKLRNRFDLERLAASNTSDVPGDRALASLAGSGMAAVATAGEGSRRSNDAMKRIGDLIGRIDAAPDLKASVDYNTRVQAEVAVLLAELIRVQSAATHTVGMQSLHRARDGVASRKFMRVGDRRAGGR